MCWRTSIDAQTLRRELLTGHGIGVVAIGTRYLRLAFSSLDEEKIPAVCSAIYSVAAALAGA